MRLIKIIFCGVLLASAACSKSTSSGNGNQQFGNKLEMPDTKPISDQQLNESAPLFKSSIEMISAVTDSSPNQVIGTHCQLDQKTSNANQIIDVVSTLIDLPPETCPVEYHSHLNGRGVNSETLVSFNGTIENSILIKDPSLFPETTFRQLIDSGAAKVQIQQLGQRASHIQGRYELEGNVKFENYEVIPFILKNDTDITVSTDENGKTTALGKISAAYGAKMSFGWVVLRVEAELTSTGQVIKCLVNERDVSSDPLCTGSGGGSYETKSHAKILNLLRVPSLSKIAI